MNFDETLEQIRVLLQSKGRVAYRALKRRFDLNDEYIEDVKAELIKADRVAKDEDGEVLVWIGDASIVSPQSSGVSSQSPTHNPQSPAAYTPPHLAERIRAEQAALEARGASDGERKTITALFADLKGSTALIEGLDPEEARAIITLPDTRERAQQELTLHVTLGAPLQATRGFSSPEVQATYTRARELCQQLGETCQLFPVLFGLRTFHQVRGEFLTARELGEQLLDLAQREHDPALLVVAYRALGSPLFQLGEFGAAQAHLAQGLTLYDTQRHHSHVFLYGIESGVFGLSYAAWVLWHLGYPDQALQKNKAARILAQELSHPFSVAAARVYAALLHQLRRESPLAQEWAEAGITLAREHGFPLWLGQGAVLQGWALAEQGQSEEGITQIRQGLATHETIGAGLLQSYFLVLLAEAYGKAGQAEEGLAALAEALTVVDKSGERFYEAELYRLKGTLTLQQFKVQGSKFQVDNPQSAIHSSQSEAEACFLRAIEIAQRQQAKSLELRAVMSLSRLWQRQGKQKEAHALLAEIYNWFTKGFDTKDLQETKALVEELASTL